MNSFTRIFQGFSSLSNFVHDFWEDCFYKPKLLLAANRVIYLNISISISKIHDPQPLVRHSFLHSITTSGETTSRYLFQRGKLCENSYILC